MAKESSKQKLVNLIQAYELVIRLVDEMSKEPELASWAKASHFSKIKEYDMLFAKNKLRIDFGIDYDAADAKKKVIKEGSEVVVLVNHMDGMEGGKGIVKSYSLPAMLCDITMKDGMKMNGHKWVTNDEVKLK